MSFDKYSPQGRHEKQVYLDACGSMLGSRLTILLGLVRYVISIIPVKDVG